MALIGISAPQICRTIGAYSSRSPNQYYSTDRFLRFSTGAPLSSETLMAFFGVLPSKPALIFISKTDRRSFLLGMVTAYLAAPHPVRLLDVTTAQTWNDLLSRDDSKKMAVLVFCGVARPRSVPIGKRFGNLEIFVPPVEQ